MYGIGRIGSDYLKFCVVAAGGVLSRHYPVEGVQAMK
jgi:hypothetical protein